MLQMTTLCCCEHPDRHCESCSHIKRRPVRAEELDSLLVQSIFRKCQNIYDKTQAIADHEKLFEEMARLIMDYPGGHTNLSPEEYKAGLVRWCLAREAVAVKLEEA